MRLQFFYAVSQMQLIYEKLCSTANGLKCIAKAVLIPLFVRRMKNKYHLCKNEITMFLYFGQCLRWV